MKITLRTRGARMRHGGVASALGALLITTAAAGTAQSATSLPAAPEACRNAGTGGTMSAMSVEGLDIEECDLEGETLKSGELTVTVPEAGETVTAHSLSDESSGDEGETLRVEVDDAGVVEVTTGQEAQDKVKASSACTETDFTTTGLGAWVKPIYWRINVGTVPKGDISINRARGSLQSAAYNMVSGRNTCGLADPVAVAQSNVGTTRRSPRISNGCLGSDGVNVIGFGSVSSSSTLAIACTYSDGRSIAEADMIFSTSKRWTPWGGSSTCSGEFDIKSVATHEFGHWMGLGHSAGRNQTMFPSIGNCDTSTRTLGRGDILGLRSLY